MVPVGIVLLYFAVRRVPDTTHKDPDAGIDFVGAALLTVGIGSLALALVQGPDWGWTDNRVLIAFAVAAVTLLSFLVEQLSSPDSVDCSGSSEDPLVLPGPTSPPSCSAAAFAAGLLSNILWLQEAWGYSALRTGFAVSPGPLLVPLFAIAGGSLTRRYSAGRVAALGSLLWAVGTVLVLVSVDYDAQLRDRTPTRLDHRRDRCRPCPADHPVAGHGGIWHLPDRPPVAQSSA